MASCQPAVGWPGGQKILQGAAVAVWGCGLRLAEPKDRGLAVVQWAVSQSATLLLRRHAMQDVGAAWHSTHARRVKVRRRL